MNRGLLEKAAHEAGMLTLLLGSALALVEALLAYVFPVFQKEIAGAWLQLGFVQDLLRALLGTEIGETIGPHVFQALPWVHPIVLAIFWTHELYFASRVPAGEVDRGTIDLLLGLPVSRWEVYLSEAFVLLVTGIFLFAMGVAGNWIGSALAGEGTFPRGDRLMALLANGYSLYLAVAGIGYVFSSWSDRRGRAVGWSLGIVLASFLLSFLAQFWEPARTLVFLSILDYYRPAAILRDGGWPLGDMTVLLALAAVAWSLAGWLFARRDIRTV